MKIQQNREPIRNISSFMRLRTLLLPAVVFALASSAPCRRACSGSCHTCSGCSGPGTGTPGNASHPYRKSSQRRYSHRRGWKCGSRACDSDAHADDTGSWDGDCVRDEQGSELFHLCFALPGAGGQIRFAGAAALERPSYPDAPCRAARIP
jgi:hypothetical protein